MFYEIGQVEKTEIDINKKSDKFLCNKENIVSKYCLAFVM